MNAYDSLVQQAPKPPMRLFIDLQTWIHAGREETGGSLSLIEQRIPSGFASVWHTHLDEDESFFIIEGELTITIGDRSLVVGPGQYAFGPRGVPHGFRVTGKETARLLLLTSGPRFADFIAETSDPAEDATPGKPGEPDLARLFAAAERHGLALLGPMPD